MRRWVTTTFAAIAALSAASVLSTPAAAMPASNLATAANELSATENVAWVCGPYRCWWTPRYYYRPVVVAPRVYYGYAPVYGWGYGPSYSYRVVGPGPWGYRRGWYGRRHWRW